MSNEQFVPKIPSAREPLHQSTTQVPPNFDDAGEIDSDRIQKGIAPRKLKGAIIGLVAAVLLIGLFYPEDKKSPSAVTEAPPPPIVQTNLVDDVLRAKPKENNTDLVEPLGEDKLAQPSAEALPLPILKPQGQVDQPSLEDERAMTALLSAMDASDVTLRKPDTARERQDAATQILLSSQAKAEKMMEESQEFARQMALQSADPSDRVAAPSNPRQNLHAQFLEQSTGANTLGPATQLDSARKVHALYEGTIVRTVLTRSIKSDLPGVVTAKVSTDLYDSITQRVLLVPRGSEVTCSYQSELMVGQELLLAACHRLRLPNGKSFALNSATASDLQGASGLPAEINNHFWQMFKNALIIGAISKLLPTEDQQISMTEGVSGRASTGGTILGTALNRVVETTVSRNLMIPPTGSVAIGTPFTLTLSRDVELEPYLR